MPSQIPMPADGYTGRICADCTMPALAGHTRCLKCRVIGGEALRRAEFEARMEIEPLADDEPTRPMQVPTPKRVRLADGMTRGGMWVELEDE